VWATRGLLWALDESTVDKATPAIVHALHDPGWRVREKAAQVVARHLIDVALPNVVELSDSDAVPRVRAAAGRAVRRLAASGK
jgi:HEAT repeat protein